MKFLNKEHYAYIKIGRNTIGDDRYGYDVDTIQDYATFGSLEEVASHYKTRNKNDGGTYFKMTPLSFDITVNVNVKEKGL